MQKTIKLTRRDPSFNFSRLISEYNKLKCPPNVFNPCKLPYDRDKYFVLCSERSVGKTTNVLLFGMVAHELYGTQIQYIRQTEVMLEPKNMRQLFATILKFDYVRKVTHNKWSSLNYYARGWYYCNRDDSGKITEQDSTPFMFCLAINRNIIYKSTYNAPDGDILIFDEFVSKFYPQDEFVDFCDLVKTIIRERQKPIVFMLGNTIDRYHAYFSEMELLKITTTMPLGEHSETITAGGVPIYVEFVTREKTAEKLTLNRLFFGFRNKKLGAITGADWSITPMQHIDKTDTPELITRNLYITIEDYLINLELVTSELYGMHVLAHFGTQTYPDSHIYSCDNMLDFRYRYKFGHDKLDKLIWTLYERKKFFYANNTIGALVDKYVSRARNEHKLY